MRSFYSDGDEHVFCVNWKLLDNLNNHQLFLEDFVPWGLLCYYLYWEDISTVWMCPNVTPKIKIRTPYCRTRHLICERQSCEEFMVLHLGFLDYTHYMLTVRFHGLESFHQRYNIIEVMFFVSSCVLYAKANPGLEVMSCGNAVLLNPPNNCITMPRYFNNNNIIIMQRLCYK